MASRRVSAWAIPMQALSWIYVPSTIDVNALYAALPPNASRLLSRGPKHFWKRMAEHGIVQSDEQGHNSVKKQRFGNGRFYRLHLSSLFR